MIGNTSVPKESNGCNSLSESILFAIKMECNKENISDDRFFDRSIIAETNSIKYINNIDLLSASGVLKCHVKLNSFYNRQF